MTSVFDVVVKTLPDLLSRLINQAAGSIEQLSVGKNDRGVYLFSESGVPIYVGRGRLKIRLKTHINGSLLSASFAVKLAREVTGMKANYRQDRSINTLKTDPTFMTEFENAKQRIRRMEVRHLAIDDDLTECLFEIYASTELKTPYNSWKTS